MELKKRNKNIKDYIQMCIVCRGTGIGSSENGLALVAGACVCCSGSGIKKGEK